MPTNWNDAVPQETGTYSKISAPSGVYNNAFFLGFTDAWEATNSCFNCKGQTGDEDCKKCKGEGRVREKMIALRYDLGNTTTEQEQMTFKIAAPRQVNGQAVRSSKLYDRLVELSGLGNTAGPGDLARWAQAHVEPIPCMVIIKQPGKYPKITEVVRRPTEAPAEAPRRTFRTAFEEMTARAKQNASAGPQGAKKPIPGGEPFDDDDFDDEEVPF
jgi:hypothetical protein